MCYRDKYFAHRAERLERMVANFFLAIAENEIDFSTICAAARGSRNIAYYADDTASRAAWCESATEIDVEAACKRWLQEEGFCL